jgi:hypothetical protein
VKVFLLVCHKAVILTFVHAVAVVKSMLSPIDAGVKDSGRAVLMLVNRQTGAINHNVVCALLTECLQDVSFLTFALHLLSLIIWFLTFIYFYIRLFL